MQIYFIRHGQSENNAVWDRDTYFDYRIADPKLTEKGIEQARLTARFFAGGNSDAPETWLDMQNRRGFGLSQIYCSLMERAVHTGTIIADHLGIPVTGVPDLHEVGGVYLKNQVNGVETIEVLYGHNPEYFQKHYPSLRLISNIPDGGWWRGGKEERPGRIDRARRMIELLKDRHAGSDDRIGVITHGGFFGYLFRVFFRIDLDAQGDLDKPYRVMYNNCGVSRFDLEGDQFMFIYHNRTDFLPDELIT